SAPAVNVLTTKGGDGTNTFSATAWSGAAATGAGVAGALALNVPGLSSEAAVKDGATLTVNGGALTVNSTSFTNNTSDALAQTSNTDMKLGVGASVAGNAALNTTKADIGSAAVTGASSIGVEAHGHHLVTTNSIAGASIDNVASAAAVSAAFSGNTTTAEMRGGPSTILVPTLSVLADDTAITNTTADGRTVS